MYSTLGLSYNELQLLFIKIGDFNVIANKSKREVFLHLFTHHEQKPGYFFLNVRFSSTGKMSPTSILCRVEAGTSTPPVPSTEDKAVATESVAVDSKMAECISKLRTVRQRLEQQPSSPSNGSAVHPAPGPIYTKTHHQPVCTVTHSPDKPAEVKVTSKVAPSPSKVALSPSNKPPKVRIGHRDARPKLIMGRDSSTDSGPDSPTNSITCNRKARKQRPDLFQMLRSTSTTANTDSPPLPAGAIPRQASSRRGIKVSPSRQPPLIPKMDMNIKDYRKHSPGVKRRSKSKLTLQTSSLATISSSVSETVTETCDLPEVNKPEADKPEVHKAEVKMPFKKLIEDPPSGSDAERPDIKVVLPKKVDANFLPSEENIKRTEKPLFVRKLTPQHTRFQEKEPVKLTEREPTKTHVDWHKRRILTRQSSLEDLHRRRRSLPAGGGGGGGVGGGNSGCVVGGAQMEYPTQRPMMSFNYHRSTGQLQVRVPDEGATAHPPVRTISRRASIDVAGIGRATATGSPPTDSPPTPPTSGGVMEGPFPPAIVHSAARGVPRRRSLILTPEFSTVQEDDVLLAEAFSTVPEEESQSGTVVQPGAFREKQSDSLEDKPETEVEPPKPPPRRKTQFRRGSVAWFIAPRLNCITYLSQTFYYQMSHQNHEKKVKKWTN